SFTRSMVWRMRGLTARTTGGEAPACVASSISCLPRCALPSPHIAAPDRDAEFPMANVGKPRDAFADDLRRRVTEAEPHAVAAGIHIRAPFRPRVERDSFRQRNLGKAGRIDLIGQPYPDEDAARWRHELGAGAELGRQRLHDGVALL